MTIPLVDLRAQYASIKGEIDAAVQAVLDDCQFYKGPHVERFEREFAARLGTKHAVGVANCTDALYLSLRALGIGNGDEVIVPAMTFIATAEAVTMAGAVPVFVDIDPETYNINLDKIGAAVTEKTKAIIPVHLCGRAVDMTRLMEIAHKYGLAVIEDCAQAAGAEWDGRPVGTFGNTGCFSFYPSKNLGAYGDGGAVVTDNDYIARKVRMLADHGREEKFDHRFPGICSRLDALQAAVLTAKLPHLDEWNSKRYEMAVRYVLRQIETKEITLPEIPTDRREHVFHCFVVRVNERDKARSILAGKEIETGLHYPTALPFTKAYSWLGHKPEDFPEAYAFSQECLSLPMYPEMTIEQVKYVSDSLIEAVRG